MTFKQKAYVILIGLIIGLVLSIPIHNWFNPKLDTITTTIIPGDKRPTITSIPKPFVFYKDTGSFHYRDTGSVQYQHTKVDTQGILAEYFYRNIYKRVLKDDTSAFISLTDTVTENMLLRGQLVFINRRPITLLSVLQPAPRRIPADISAGIFFGGSTKQFALGPSVTLKMNSTSYAMQADLLNKAFYLTYSKCIWHK